MTLREKTLYHQIHPAKLATDILAAIVSVWFLWRHELAIGLAVHFLPPVIASGLLVPFANLEAQKASSLGRYISRHMTRTVEAVRLAGDIVLIAGAWYRAPLVIAAGVLVVIGGWASGLLPLRR